MPELCRWNSQPDIDASLGDHPGQRELTGRREPAEGAACHECREGGLVWPYTAILIAVLLAIAPMRSSLWLDETVTAWVTQDGLREIFHRSWFWTGQSPLYYLFAWTATSLGGSSEVVLRLPSLLAFMAATWLLYQLGTRLAGKRIGMFSALAFVCLPEASFAAIDARPYALAMLCVIASVFSLVAWIRTQSVRWAAVYVVTSTLVVYSHCVFATALAAQAIYTIRHIRLRASLVAWLSIGVLCSPLLFQWLTFFHARQSHSFSATPGLPELFAAIAPPTLAGAFVLASLLPCVFGASLNVRFPKLPFSLVGAWLLIPPCILLLISACTQAKLFLPRYCLASAPAAALLAGWAIGSLSRCSRGIAVVTFVLGLGLHIWQTGPLHGQEAWREATAALKRDARPADPVLVASGFVEARGDAVDDPNLSNALFSPQLVYGSAGKMERLPRLFDGAAIRRLQRMDLPSLDRFFLIARHAIVNGADDAEEYESWLKHTLACVGFQCRPVGRFGRVSVLRFDRTAERSAGGGLRQVRGDAAP